VTPKINRPLDIYVRVSDVRGRSGESFISPKDQEQRCRALALARGYEVGEVFEELNVSGGSMDRPALNKALERIRLGESGGIIVARMDRFSRTLKGAIETLERLEEAGGYLIECDGDWDTSTPMGRFGRDLVIRLGQLYREQIADQWQTAKKHAVDRGIHIAPRTPAGYQVDPKSKRLVLDGRNAKTISNAYAMAAAGDSYRSIADLFNDRRLPLWGGEGVWQPNRIRRLLANRVYLGEARSGNGHANLSAHPPLVDEPTFLLAQRHTTHERSITRASTSLLAGLCRCASCSYAMKHQAQGKTAVAIYRCASKTTTVHNTCFGPSSISAANLEEYVIGQFLARSSLELHPQEDVEGSAEAVEAALAAKRTYDAWLENTDTGLEPSSYLRRLKALEEAWRSSEEAVPKPRASTASGAVDLSALVTQLRKRDDVSGLRELLASAIAAVFVRPAASRANNLPIGDRVRIVWNDEDLSLVLPKRGERFKPHQFAW
jgi:site-specific DNA recombinase